MRDKLKLNFQEEMEGTFVIRHFPLDLRRELKLKAVREGVSMNQLILQAIIELLAK